MKGELALVTGGSRGVGRAIVARLAGAGARVAFCYRRDVEAAERVARETGGHAYPADLSVPGAATALVARVTDELGAPSILVSNAGTASRGRLALDTEQSEYLALFQVHVLAALEAARAVAPAMRAAGRGAIVLVSSTTTTLRPPGSAPYTAAKAALEAAAAVLAVEERAHGIRVNVVAPGLVATDMGDRLVRASTAAGAKGGAGAGAAGSAAVGRTGGTTAFAADGTKGGAMSGAADLDAASPFGRVCRPEDVADVVAFLAGPDSSYVAGQRVVVDGGGATTGLLPVP